MGTVFASIMTSYDSDSMTTSAEVSYYSFDTISNDFHIYIFAQLPEYPISRRTLPHRPRRSTVKRTSLPGFVDPSELRFDSEDEGDVSDLHQAKKPCLDEDAKSQFPEPEVSRSPPPPPPTDTSSLTYYPELLDYKRRFNRSLNLPPPIPEDDILPKSSPYGSNKRKRASKIYPPILSPQPPPAPLSLIVKLQLPRGTIDKNASYDPNKTGFMDLPSELRNVIYFLTFKKSVRVDFQRRTGFAHTSAFLRVNKAIYNEARYVLYGENHFMLGHNTSKIGNWYDHEWHEIGYSHVRNFLASIGPENTSLITHLTILLEDGTPSGNPGKDVEDRRYTNDEIVLWILNYLASHGKIRKLKVGFSGRRVLELGRRDSEFLQALSGVKTDEILFGHPAVGYHWKKASQYTLEVLRGVMVRPLPLNDLDPRLVF